jgi:hypothetical protein
MICPVEKRTKQELSLAIAEQVADAAFKEQGRRACEHIWEKVDQDIHQCWLCGDILDLRNWMSA